MGAVGTENKDPNSAEYQAVWQLEFWRRAEEAKFKSWLKQREVERIDEVTREWKAKETERDRVFNEALTRVN